MFLRSYRVQRSWNLRRFWPRVFQVEKREREVHTRTLSPWNHNYSLSRNVTMTNDYRNKWSQILHSFHAGKKNWYPPPPKPFENFDFAIRISFVILREEAFSINSTRKSPTFLWNLSLLVSTQLLDTNFKKNFWIETWKICFK